MKRLFPILFLATFWASPVLAGWFGPDNYEDCMLEKMKGQPSQMYSTADTACKRMFHVEEEMDIGSVKWKFSQKVGGAYISILESPTEYEIVSGEFAFSEKDCEGLKKEDYHQPVTLRFSNGETRVPSNQPSACARVLSVRGKYK